jgi:magnesium transporter
MNVPYPGSGETSGVIVSLLVILGVSGALYYLFRRGGWL